MGEGIRGGESKPCACISIGTEGRSWAGKAWRGVAVGRERLWGGRGARDRGRDASRGAQDRGRKARGAGGAARQNVYRQQYLSECGGLWRSGVGLYTGALPRHKHRATALQADSGVARRCLPFSAPPHREARRGSGTASDETSQAMHSQHGRARQQVIEAATAVRHGGAPNLGRKPRCHGTHVDVKPAAVAQPTTQQSAATPAAGRAVAARYCAHFTLAWHAVSHSQRPRLAGSLRGLKLTTKHARTCVTPTRTRHDNPEVEGHATPQY